MADNINIATKEAGDMLTSHEFNEIVQKSNTAFAEINANKAGSDLKEQQQDTALSNEASVRAQADTALSEAIAAEATARSEADALKVDKVEGKGLSTEDYTTSEKEKLGNVDENANNYTHPASHSMSIMNETEDRKIMTAEERVKLANIEGNATTDQTGSEIKAVYEPEAGISEATAQTTDASITVLPLDVAAQGLATMTVFHAFVSAFEPATGAAGAYRVEGAIINMDGTTSVVDFTTITITATEGAANWNVLAQANDTTNKLELTVKGEESKTINWHCRLQLI